MTEYEAACRSRSPSRPRRSRSLAEAFSEAGWRQFHVAETEKYAHVTYFFNGGREAPCPGEERLLVPSPKVATYDLQPEMSAAGVTDALVEAIESGTYDFIVANYANPDMVGHTGVWEATVAGARGARRLPRPGSSPRSRPSRPRDPTGPGALLAITADHGNADEMRDATGAPVTAHSLNPVPIVVDRAGGARAGDCATASWPTSRRRCSSWPACRAGTA